MEYHVTVINYKTGNAIYEATHNRDSFAIATTNNSETEWKELHVEMVQCNPSFDFKRIHYTCWVKLPEPYSNIIASFNDSGSLMYIEPKKTTLTKEEIEATMQPIEVR